MVWACPPGRSSLSQSTTLGRWLAGGVPQVAWCKNCSFLNEASPKLRVIKYYISNEYNFNYNFLSIFSAPRTNRFRFSYLSKKIPPGRPRNDLEACRPLHFQRCRSPQRRSVAFLLDTPGRRWNFAAPKKNKEMTSEMSDLILLDTLWFSLYLSWLIFDNSLNRTKNSICGTLEGNRV